MMRWMESLVERTGSGGYPTIQRLWERESRELSYPTLDEGFSPNQALNLSLALLALILLFPLLLVIALLVWLTSRGPVFYSQVRVGLDRRRPARVAQNHRRERDLGGRPFTIYK
ncbi:MAG TPA: sugar transferase, partial [Gemmatimonadales bacterium]|nr:sugar transferase [Gemmatimonadales bacterium]